MARGTTSGVPSAASRGVAGFVALVAAVTLATRLYLRLEQSDGLLDALAYMSQYFTILTNAITFLVLAWIAAGRDLPPRWIKAVVIAIACVGVVYHSLLAHLVNLNGLELWADHGTHTFVPILTVAWWIFLAPKPDYRTRDLPLWIAWPSVYCVYILTRASYSGFYPYPFLNVPEIGWGGLARAVGGLLLGFVLVGLVLGWSGRLAAGRAAN